MRSEAPARAGAGMNGPDLARRLVLEYPLPCPTNMPESERRIRQFINRWITPHHAGQAYEELRHIAASWHPRNVEQSA